MTWVPLSELIKRIIEKAAKAAEKRDGPSKKLTPPVKPDENKP